MIISFEYNGPMTEISIEFIQGMLNRMAMSEIRYGKIKDAYPDKVNALDSVLPRLKKYRETGNKDFLIDAANFYMIEFIHPLQQNTFFEPTDASESPGRKWHDKKLPTSKANKE